jgi:LPS-assembly lipoprotein
MSLHKLLNRRTASIALAATLLLGVTGCFRPLYGPTASGAPVEAVMTAIDVGTVSVPTARQEMGHTLRSELIFALDGSGLNAEPKRYRLTATVTDSLTTPLVSSATGRAVSATIMATAAWQIVDVQTNEVLFSGSAQAAASYDRTIQRFAALRAQRDAETRIAKQLSEQIASRIAIDIRAIRQDI